MRKSPGDVRDSILDFLAATDSASNVEIYDAVEKRLGKVARSSVRSWLNLNVPEKIERLDRGRYRLRREEPVKLFDLPLAPGYLVTRYDDVIGVLKDAGRYSSRANAKGIGLVMGRTILEMDGKEHQKHRSIVQHAFHFKSIAPVEEYMARTLDELIDRFAADGRANLVEQFTEPFPIRVVARIAGVPIEDFEIGRAHV